MVDVNIIIHTVILYICILYIVHFSVKFCNRVQYQNRRTNVMRVLLDDGQDGFLFRGVIGT